MPQKNAGVQHIVKFSGLSAADEDSSFVFAAMHREIEQHLEQSGMRWTHLRPGQFMTEYLREVPTILGQNALFLPFNDARLTPVDVKDIAKAAFTILTTTGHEGKIYALTGPESLSMDEVAKRIGQATSFEVKYVNISPETRNQMLLSMGVPPFFVDALAAQTRERWKGKESTVHLHAYQELGLTPTTFAEFAQRNAAAFLGETKYAGLS